MTKMKTRTLLLTVILLAAVNLLNGQAKIGFNFNKIETMEGTGINVLLTDHRYAKIGTEHDESLLFVDTKTNDARLLSLPEGYQYSNYEVCGGSTFKGEKYVLIIAQKRKANRREAKFFSPFSLFITDLMGQNTKMISPDHFHVFSWKILEETNTLTFLGKEDTDRNGKFNRADKSKVYVLDLTTGDEAKEVFSVLPNLPDDEQNNELY